MGAFLVVIQVQIFKKSALAGIWTHDMGGTNQANVLPIELSGLGFKTVYDLF